MEKTNLFCLVTLLFVTGCFGKVMHPTDVGAGYEVIDHSLRDLDLLQPGDVGFDVRDYAFPAAVDTILDPPVDGSRGEKTQVAGRLYLPKTESPAPILVLLHGNHSTCGLFVPGTDPATDPRFDFGANYTSSGACLAGEIVVPNHLGYDYLGRHLASRGFAVVTIDANRGITGINGNNDTNWSLVIPRGRLVLRHLEVINSWNREGDEQGLLGGLAVRGRFNLNSVGLMGHSRGGEGVRVALNMYEGTGSHTYQWKNEKPEIGFRGIFEIGPVDFGSDGGSLLYNAGDTPWTVLIPGCDGDVSNYMGVNPYRRMVANAQGQAKRSVVVAWGANHNFFNTEWQVSDSRECEGNQIPLWDNTAPIIDAPDWIWGGNANWWNWAPPRRGVKGSEAQRQIAKFLLTAFFEANLKDNVSLGRVFDPQYSLPEKLAQLAPFAREHTDAAHGRSLKSKTIIDGVLHRESVEIEDFAHFLDSRWMAFADSLRLRYGHNAEIERVSNTPLSALLMRWNAEGLVRPPSVDFSVPADGMGADVGYLDLVLNRVDECQYLVQADACRDYPEVLDFSVALVSVSGEVSRAVIISDYVQLKRHRDSTFSVSWVDGFNSANSYSAATVYAQASETLLNTVPLATADFIMDDGSPFPLRDLAAVRFVFDRSRAGGLVLENVFAVRR